MVVRSVSGTPVIFSSTSVMMIGLTTVQMPPCTEKAIRKSPHQIRHSPK